MVKLMGSSRHFSKKLLVTPLCVTVLLLQLRVTRAEWNIVEGLHQSRPNLMFDALLNTPIERFERSN